MVWLAAAREGKDQAVGLRVRWEGGREEGEEGGEGREGGRGGEGRGGREGGVVFFERRRLSD